MREILSICLLLNVPREYRRYLRLISEVVQLVECLLCIREVVGLIPSHKTLKMVLELLFCLAFSIMKV